MKHDPDPEFLARLEWQTETALRRRERFASPVPTGALRVVRTLALVLCCTLCGAGLVIGAERLQQSREAEFLLEQNRVQQELADSRLDHAVQRLAELTMRAENGLIGQPPVLRAEREVLSRDRHRVRLSVEREEIEASGRAPDPSITAPRVGGRDFATEYLQLELDVLAGRIDEAQQLASISEARCAAGLITSSERDRDRLELRRLELQLQRVQGRVALRGELLSGLLDARGTLRRDRREAAKLRQAEALLEIEVLDGELAGARILAGAGRVSGDELRGLEGELEELRANLELAELELKLLEEPR